MATVSRNLIEILIAARDEASDVLKKTGSNVASVEKQVAVSSAAIAAAGTAFLAAVTASATAGGRYADTLQDLSAQLLVTRETLASLGVQLIKGGGQWTDAEVAVRTFNRAVVDAVGGNKDAVAQFERLGISVDQLVGPGGSIRSFEELLPAVADGFAKVGSGALQIDSAVSLFGRSATALVPILGRGSAGLAQMQQEARNANAILAGPLQDNAARFGDRLDDLQTSVSGLNQAMAGALDPTLGQTITALADAAKAAGQFAQAHPAIVRTVTGTIGILAGAGGLIAALILTRTQLLRLFAVMQANGVLKALGGTFENVAGRVVLANGKFASARTAFLANALAMGRLVGVAGLLSGALSLLVSENDRMRREQQEFTDATKDAEKALKDETKSAYEQIEALNQLREAKARAASKDKPEAPGLVRTTLQGEARINFERSLRQKAAEDAKRQFDEETAGLRSVLEARAAFERIGLKVPATITVDVSRDIKILGPTRKRQITEALSRWYDETVNPAIESLGPTVEAAKTLPVAAPSFDFQPIDTSDFEAQLARARELREKARAEFNAIASGIRPGVTPSAEQTEKLTAAREKLEQATQRAFDAERSFADAQRRAADQARDAEAAMTAMEAATGRLSLDEVMGRNVAALERANAELDAAEKAAKAAVPGTQGYIRAQDNLTAAINRQRDAQAALDGTRTTIADRHREQAEAAEALADALTQLAQAEEDLATAQSGAKPDTIQQQLEARNLERLKQARERARSLANTDVGPVPVERIQASADATRNYTDAVVAMADAHEKSSAAAAVLNTSLGAVSQVLSLIGNTAAQMAVSMINALLGIIRTVLDLVASLNKARAATVALSTLGGGPLGLLGGIVPFGLFSGKQSGGELMSGIRGVDNTTVRIGKGEGIFSHSMMDRMDAFLARTERGGGAEIIGQPSQPAVVLKQDVHFNTGLRMGTEIEDQRAARELGDSSVRYLRGFVGSPSFTR